MVIYGIILSWQCSESRFGTWSCHDAVGIVFQWIAGAPDAKPTELDRLPPSAKLAVVVAVGAVVFMLALLLND